MIKSPAFLKRTACYNEKDFLMFKAMHLENQYFELVKICLCADSSCGNWHQASPCYSTIRKRMALHEQINRRRLRSAGSRRGFMSHKIKVVHHS